MTYPKSFRSVAERARFASIFISLVRGCQRCSEMQSRVNRYH